MQAGRMAVPCCDGGLYRLWPHLRRQPPTANRQRPNLQVPASDWSSYSTCAWNKISSSVTLKTATSASPTASSAGSTTGGVTPALTPGRRRRQLAAAAAAGASGVAADEADRVRAVSRAAALLCVWHCVCTATNREHACVLVPSPPYPIATRQPLMLL